MIVLYMKTITIKLLICQFDLILKQMTGYNAKKEYSQDGHKDDG